LQNKRFWGSGDRRARRGAGGGIGNNALSPNPMPAPVAMLLNLMIDTEATEENLRS